MTENYKTISTEVTTEFKDRGSRFLGYAFPVNSADLFKKKLKELKAEHPKANHHCFAYRFGLDKNNFRSSDDGEPAGSAGKPILGQIDSKELTDTAVIIVRYFGGTLLGIPGLINAYKTTTSLLLQLSPIVVNNVTKEFTLHFGHAEMNDVLVLFKKLNIEILEKDINLFCQVKAAVDLGKAEHLENFINNNGLEVRWR